MGAPQGIRPLFDKAWAASEIIYNKADNLEERRQRVANIIGGLVAYNINHPDPKLRWNNTCAVRMSYILNHSGFRIPFIPKQTVSGGDKKFKYFYRVNHLINFLYVQWDKPEIVRYPPSGGGTLIGKKGIILFEVSGWSDAKGHATLFNGYKCYDSCYFNEPESTYTTDRANFWSLL
ncbi:type VI secretion system amidase effector protein Tae4 [Snodgrassella alvi]|uniref:type VI secretion system amidase effector protein Tae4 n=1 Tax=Snodgrassella alvi TaxID=1196083 RepID=UPI001C557632|nr:type VI secretion system amidase effector protein Tae4 [Snodgrassella alvi]